MKIVLNNFFLSHGCRIILKAIVQKDQSCHSHLECALIFYRVQQRYAEFHTIPIILA